MMKQKDEFRYQELVEYIFGKADEEIKEKGKNLYAFNILTLGMQVIDDNVYVCCKFRPTGVSISLEPV